MDNRINRTLCILQRIAKCTRNGGPNDIQLQRYVEAMDHEGSGLTYPALVGLRKQSVEDAERMFSSTLLKFMEDKGYACEANYIRAVLGWRRACDERGLSELVRCRLNYRMLNYVLKELMPWYEQTYDFSLLEVNRYAEFCMSVLSSLTNQTTFSHVCLL